MKKYLALLIIALIALCLSAPLIAAAETAASAPPDTAQAVFLEPTEAPAVETATEDAQETDPGGAPIDLTPLFQAFVSVLGSILTIYLIPWIRAHIKGERLAQFDYWTEVAVAAAEKAYGAGKGKQKLARATEIMKDHGFTIDEDAVDAAIKRMFESAKDNGQDCN